MISNSKISNTEGMHAEDDAAEAAADAAEALADTAAETVAAVDPAEGEQVAFLDTPVEEYALPDSKNSFSRKPPPPDDSSPLHDESAPANNTS